MDKKIKVKFTEEELYAMAEFFGPNATMEDHLYDKVARKLLIAASKAGLYDTED